MKVVDMLKYIHEDQHVKSAFTKRNRFCKVAGQVYCRIRDNIDRNGFAACIGLSKISMPRADIEKNRIPVQALNLRLQKAPVCLPPGCALIGSAFEALVYVSCLRHGGEDWFAIQKREIASA